MLGFLFGSACLLGLAGVARHGCGGYVHAGGPCGEGWRARHGGCGGGHAGWHRHHAGGQGHGGWRERWGSPRTLLRSVFERLETSPGQEKVILDAVEKVRGAAEAFRGELGNIRSELSRAVRGEHFEATSVRELFGKHDELIKNVREELVGGLARIHEALDDRQRRELAEIIEEVGRFGRGRWA